MVSKPFFLILINEDDKTDVIFEKLVSLSLTDNANNESDELEIIVSGRFKRPSYKDQIKVYFGNEYDFKFMGLFRVQSTVKSLTQLTIRATGVDFSDSFKVKRNITYERLSIKDIVSQIASRHNLKVKSNLNHIYFLSQSQTNESDMHFLNRLANEYNAIFNVKNDTLYFMQKIKENKKSDDLPIYTIDLNLCKEVSIEHSNKTSYNSCEVTWHDTKENKTISKVYPTNGGEPILKFNGSFKNSAQAIERAKAKLEKANQGLIKGNLKKEGEPVYAAGVMKIVNNIDLEEEPYQITKVTHDINKADGWTTSIEFER